MMKGLGSMMMNLIHDVSTLVSWSLKFCAALLNSVPFIWKSDSKRAPMYVYCGQ